jgi:hypothetical protein
MCRIQAHELSGVYVLVNFLQIVVARSFSWEKNWAARHDGGRAIITMISANLLLYCRGEASGWPADEFGAGEAGWLSRAG